MEDGNTDSDSERSRILITQLKPENIKEIYYVLEIYYKNYMEIYHMKSKEEVINYEKKLYGPNYEFLSFKNLSDSLKNKNNLLFVIKINNNIVGFTYIKIFHKSILIDEIHVKTKGLGIGSKLLNFIEEYCKKNGLKRIILGSCKQALKFYQKKGFCLFGKTYDGYYLMKKRI